MIRTPGIIAAVALVGALTTACGSDNSSKEATADKCVGLEAAQDWVKDNSSNPTSIDISAALPAAPKAGKKVVRLTTPVPVSVIADEASKEAAESLGWDYDSINVERDAEGIQRAFKSALSMKPAPNAIILSGFPAATYAEQLAEAKSRGIYVIANSTTDKSGPGDTTPDASITGPAQVRKWGKDIAAYVVAESNCTAKAAVFNLSAYPVLAEFEKGFNEAIEEWCPSCEVTSVDQQVSDLGTVTPQSVVSTFQRDPDLEWAVFAQGDISIGVPAALQAAGLADRVRVVGESANEANLQQLKSGDEEAWTGYASPYLGYAAIDAAARLIEGQDVAPAEKAYAPSMIITKDNVEKIATDDGGYFIGVQDYPAQFKKLWSVG